MRGAARGLDGMRSRGLFFTTVALVIAVALGAGCRSEPYARPLTYADAYDTYEPQYVNGYVIYYDGAGRPYHYADGVVVWLPMQSPHYNRLTQYWVKHQAAYRRWYVSYGYRYRDYRLPHRRSI
jgi:hypothetical protein